MVDTKKWGVRFSRLNAMTSNRLSDKQSSWLFDNFDKIEWDDLIFDLYGSRKDAHRLVISPEAITLSMKVKDEHDLLLFPMVHRITSPTKDAGEGSWFMQDIRRVDYFSADHIRNFSKKNIYIHIEWDSREITAELKYER